LVRHWVRFGASFGGFLVWQAQIGQNAGQVDMIADEAARR
jgi:hypothetical protein